MAISFNGSLLAVSGFLLEAVLALANVGAGGVDADCVRTTGCGVETLVLIWNEL